MNIKPNVLALVFALSSVSALAQDHSGLHVGITAGLGQGNVNETPDYARPQASMSGGLLGLQIGATKQFDNVVVGFDTGIARTRIRGSRTTDTCAGCVGFSSSQNDKTDLEWLGTALIRFGYSFGRVVPYIVGGLAYGSVKTTTRNEWRDSMPTPTPSPTPKAVTFGSNTNSVTQGAFGHALGVGVEFFVTPRVSMSAEYLRTDLGLSKNENNFSYQKTNLISNNLNVAVKYTF